MRKIIIGVLLLVIASLVIYPNYRWLVVNGAQAQNCAKSMLESNSTDCDWFNHMVVSSSDGMVSFYEHDSNVIYAYSPNHLPSNAKRMTWTNIYNFWYVGVIKT
jgi:hypothetical protein